MSYGTVSYPSNGRNLMGWFVTPLSSGISRNNVGGFVTPTKDLVFVSQGRNTCLENLLLLFWGLIFVSFQGLFVLECCI